MYEYFSGRLASLEPTRAVVDCGGVGYLLEITLATYEALRQADPAAVTLHAHLALRDDAQQLFGFHDPAERAMFRLLIGVSGVGCQSARVVLSALSVSELRRAIQSGDARSLQRVKGIGPKTAQRIVIELADRMGSTAELPSALSTPADPAPAEAEAALLMLGYPRAAVTRLLASRTWRTPDGSPMTVEEIVKEALRQL